MDARRGAIFVFQFVKPILQTITYLTQYTVLEIQFWSVKCTTAWYAKISSTSIPSHQAMRPITISRLNENKPPHNAFNPLNANPEK